MGVAGSCSSAPGCENEVTLLSLSLAIKYNFRVNGTDVSLVVQREVIQNGLFFLKIRTYLSILIYTHLDPLVFDSYV